MRLAKVDNYKVLLTFLVVLGHVMVFMRVENFEYIMNIIYSFHMPAFIFINGFLFKDIQIKKYFKLLIIFLLMQFFYLFYFKWIGYYNSISFENIFIPAFHLWYLLAFIVWSMITKSINIIKNKSNLLFTLLILLVMTASLTVRLTNINIHDQYLTYTRIFVFLPFFLSGYYSKNIIKSINEKTSIKIISILIIVLSIISVILFTYLGLLPKTLLFFGFSHIQSLNTSSLSFFGLEILQVIIAFAFIFSLYSLTSTKHNKFTDISSNVTFIYLVHPMIVSLLIKWDFTNYSFFFNMILSITISFIVFILLNTISKHLKINL